MLSIPVYVINLAHMTERMSGCLENLTSVGIPRSNIHRFDAFYTPSNGMLGCSKSHFSILSSFLSSDDEFMLVLEDDFRFDITWDLFSNIFNQFLINRFEWSVFQISARAPSFVNLYSFSLMRNYIDVVRILRAGSTGAYLVSRQGAYAIVRDFLDSVQRLESYSDFIDSSMKNLSLNVSEETVLHKRNMVLSAACDMTWNRSQMSGHFVGVNAQIGHHLEEISTITGRRFQDNHHSLGHGRHLRNL